MPRIAVYPGTFDPITNGHVDIINRGAQLLDALVIGVATSSRKTPRFSLDDRLQMCKEAFADNQKITVISMDNLLVDFAKNNNASIILRGLRAVSDFDYEFQLAGMNRVMGPHIETLFLPATEAHAFISATMVREILSLGGDITPFVPKQVLSYL